MALRRKEKRAYIVAACVMLAVLLALKWEYDLVTSRTPPHAPHVDAKDDGAPSPAPPLRTTWGFVLQGTDDYWRHAGISCEMNDRFSYDDLKAATGVDGSPLYLLIRGYVVDVTKFRAKHPGGEAILDGAGIDASETFELHHQPITASLLSNFCIGRLYPDLRGPQSRHELTDESTAKAQEKAKKQVKPPPGVSAEPVVDGRTPWGYKVTGSEEFWKGHPHLACPGDERFTMKDLEENAGVGGEGARLFLAIRGYVIDVTKFRAQHPGGEAILGGAKIDATLLFEQNHQPLTAELALNFCVGRIYDEPQEAGGGEHSDAAGHSEAGQGEHGGSGSGDAGAAARKKTSWGYVLEQGSSEYWEQAPIECKGTGEYNIEDIRTNNGGDEGGGTEGGGTEGGRRKYYLLLRGYVFDVTKFREKHPGGEAIMQGAGVDASAHFEENHSADVAGRLSNFCVGRLMPGKEISAVA